MKNEEVQSKGREAGREEGLGGWGRCSLDTLDTCRLVGPKSPLFTTSSNWRLWKGKRNKAKKNYKRMSE